MTATLLGHLAPPPLLRSLQNAIKLKDVLISGIEVAVIVVLLDTLQLSAPSSWMEHFLDHCSVQAATLTAADSVWARRVQKHLAFRQRIEQK